MASDKFIFYKEWWDAISGLPEDIRGEVCEGIIRYAFGETVAGLGNMATMAMRFITPQIDRDREKYEAKCEQNRANASERKRSLTNANGRKQSQADASERMRTGGNNKDKDNDNNNSLSLSLSPLESRESCESEEDTGGVSAADRERIFEILFFRNLKNPEKETDRLIDHYSAVGWRRHGDIRAVKDRTSLAKGWMPENKEQGIGKFQPDVLAKMQAIYAEIKAESPQDASTIIHGTLGIEETTEHTRIICERQAYEAYERHSAIILANNLTNGKRLKYGVPKR